MLTTSSSWSRGENELSGMRLPWTSKMPITSPPIASPAAPRATTKVAAATTTFPLRRRTRRRTSVQSPSAGPVSASKRPRRVSSARFTALLLKLLLEPRPGLCERGADSSLLYPASLGNLRVRQIGEVVQEDDQPTLGRQCAKRFGERRIAFGLDERRFERSVQAPS